MKYKNREALLAAIKESEVGSVDVHQGAARVSSNNHIHSSGFTACTACIVVNKDTGDVILLHLDKSIYQLGVYSSETKMNQKMFFEAAGEKEAILVHGSRYNVSNVMDAEQFLKDFKVPIKEEITVKCSQYWWAIRFEPKTWEMTIFNEDTNTSKVSKPFGKRIEPTKPQDSMMTKLARAIEVESAIEEVGNGFLYRKDVAKVIQDIRAEGNGTTPPLPELFAALKSIDNGDNVRGFKAGFDYRSMEKDVEYIIRYQQLMKAVFEIFKEKYPDSKNLVREFVTQIELGSYELKNEQFKSQFPNEYRTTKLFL
jgi:hypothetical protein